MRFVSRLQWVAQPPSNELNDLELPAERVIIAHTATESCETQVKILQKIKSQLSKCRLKFRNHNKTFLFILRLPVSITSGTFKHFTLNHRDGMILPIIFWLAEMVPLTKVVDGIKKAHIPEDSIRKVFALLSLAYLMQENRQIVKFERHLC